MKKRWLIAGVGAVALAASMIPFLARESDTAPATAATTAAAAEAGVCDAQPEEASLGFTVKDLEGRDVNFAAFKGKVVLLDFWATWCGPCKVEIPGFVELQDRYRDQGLVVLGFSVDDPEAKLQEFAKEYKMNYPVLVGRDRQDVQDAFGPLWGLPVTFLIDRDGNICKKHVGMTAKEQFEKEIKSLL